MPRQRPQSEAIRKELRDERARVEEPTAPADDAGADGDAAEAEAPAAEADGAGAVEEAAEAPSSESEVGSDRAADLERERDEYLELARRTQADFENYRKRAAKELAAAGGRAKVGLLRELLPVLDNLERALASADASDGALAEGVRLVHSELVGALARNGVEALEPNGEPFDPNLHEALTTRAQEGAEAGVVLDVVEKGYRLGDTIVRPARVVVSQ